MLLILLPPLADNGASTIGACKVISVETHKDHMHGEQLRSILNATLT